VILEIHQQEGAEVLFLALNAKYSHTSLAVRCLREMVPGSEILELTINDHLPSILAEVYARQPRVLGIACYIWNIELVKPLLRLLPKALPQTVLICGGPEVSYETGAFLRAFPMVDFVIRGEGEQVAAALCEGLRRHGGETGAWADAIPGIAFRDPSGQVHEGAPVAVADLSRLPFPYRAEEIPAIREKILYYETSRGCPFSCAYCLSCATSGVRFLPLSRVFRELDFFVAQDVRQVKLVDRTFNAKKSHFLPILRHLLALPPSCRTNFHFEVAIDYLDEEALEVLRQMPRGRVQLEIGIQSTNEQTLAAVARVNHWERISTHIRRLLSFHNMHLHVDLIIGLPGEGMDSFHRSFNDVYALHADMLQIGFLKFLKGAAMMRLVDRYHYLFMDMAPYEVMASDALTYGEIRWLHIFVQVFELYANAGRCRRTTAFLIRTQTQGDAFRFWAQLADWWEQKGYHRIRHAARDIYGRLRAFAEEVFSEDPALLDNLLRYDALLADRGRIRPADLDWNLLRYRGEKAAFWHSEAPQALLKDFELRDWRSLRARYHIEVFGFDVQAAEDERPVRRRRTALLFDYTGPEVRVQEVHLPERST
jgi:radical SAM superfamily enzyme YgiQ (UPF0313 family)